MENNIQQNSDQLENIKKYALLLEYEGSAFAGNVSQPDLRTVQDELEKALSTALRENVKVSFAGRTDAGVRALGQIAQFTTAQEFELYKLVYSINGILPEDIAIRQIESVPMGFDARRSALQRWYRYVIYNHPFKTALNKDTLHIFQPLNIDLMNQALLEIIGTHDFASFKGANSDADNSNCTVYKAYCIKERDFIYIDIVANRFVYNMVRILVGTLLEIGKGEKPVSHLGDLLQVRDRTQSGITAKPEALTLMAVEYPEELDLFRTDSNPKVKEIMLGNIMEAQYEDLFSKAS